MDGEGEDFNKVKRKIRSYCGVCYQFFENSPYTKVCREHYQKANCGAYDCKKGTNCVRKFPNHNSANRHTYCFSVEEVNTWDEGIDIQKCLGGSANKSNICINNSIDTPEKEKIFNTSSPLEEVSYQKDLFGEVNCSLKFDFFEQQSVKDNNQSLLSEHHGTSQLFFIDKKLDCDAESLVDEFDKFNFNFEKEASKLTEGLKDKTVLTSSKIADYSVRDDTSIDEITELVYNATKIPKSALNKLKSAFKKRGLMTAEIIRLLKAKTGNWDFLYEDFKDVCTQIQGIAVYLENLLEQKIK
jgi:hypothetical protein